MKTLPTIILLVSALTCQAQRTDRFAQGIRGQTGYWTPQFATVDNALPSAWWDAAIITDGVNGQDYTNWVAHTGGYTFTQLTTNGIPNYTNSINGKPALVFAGEASRECYSAGDNLDILTNGVSLFVVAKISSSDGVVGKIHFGSQNGRYFLTTGAADVQSIYQAGASLTATWSSNFFNRALYVSQNDRTRKTELRVNGVSRASQSTTAGTTSYDTTTHFMLGASYTPTVTGFLEGYVHEVLVYIPELTTNGVLQVEQYLMQKYGL